MYFTNKTNIKKLSDFLYPYFICTQKSFQKITKKTKQRKYKQWLANIFFKTLDVYKNSSARQPDIYKQLLYTCKSPFSKRHCINRHHHTSCSVNMNNSFTHLNVKSAPLYFNSATKSFRLLSQWISVYYVPLTSWAILLSIELNFLSVLKIKVKSRSLFCL